MADWDRWRACRPVRLNPFACTPSVGRELLTECVFAPLLLEGNVPKGGQSEEDCRADPADGAVKAKSESNKNQQEPEVHGVPAHSEGPADHEITWRLEGVDLGVLLHELKSSPGEERNAQYRNTHCAGSRPCPVLSG